MTNRPTQEELGAAWNGVIADIIADEYLVPVTDDGKIHHFIGIRNPYTQECYVQPGKEAQYKIEVQFDAVTVQQTHWMGHSATYQNVTPHKALEAFAAGMRVLGE